MSLIDVHTHLGDIMLSDAKRKPLTAEQLVDTMNRNGIDQSVLLPLDSPEASDRYFSTEHALSACDKFPERLLAFCCVDPRRTGKRKRIEEYKKMGCIGFGEHKVGLTIDDRQSVEIYEICGELELPVLMHLDHLVNTKLNFDQPGLPNFQKVVEQLPDTSFIMHGPGWWSEISTDAVFGVAYPDGPVNPGGAAELLMQNYPNVYSDLSAGSGHNALTRDPDFTAGFLERNWSKLMFATDYLHAGQDLPIIQYVKELPLDDEKAEAIRSGNAKRVLKIG